MVDGAGTYTACGRKRSHHQSKRLQTTRTRKRTAVVGACTSPAGILPLGVVVDAVLESAVTGFGRVAGAALTVWTGSALLTPGWTTSPHLELLHFRAGNSLGTGGGVMVTNGGVEVGGGYTVGGIVGGGCAPACTERGITAKFG